MPRITEELLRKRAEHNEGCLSSLEEVTLHQFELEKIENLDVYCRHLKIVYLQNNIIEKMENLNKLKELEYLNLALNNISMIENIEGCQSLKKLDLTVNFVDLADLEESMVNLSKVESIRELYMTGNPCTDWKGYKEFTIATVQQLDSLDGKDITKSERIQAIQKYDELLADLYYQIELKQAEKEKQKIIEEEEKKKQQDQPQVDPKDEKKPYTKEVRREMYLEMAADKEKKEREKNPEKYKEKKVTPIVRPDGEIRQCNEGKYRFKLREWDDADFTFFEIDVPKYLDTSLLEVNLNPKYVSVRIKGKLTQLKLQEEIKVEQSKIQRSQITGVLSITMPKLMRDEVIAATQLNEKQQKVQEEQEKKKIEQNKTIQKNETQKLCEKYEQKVVVQHKADHTTFDDIPDLE